MIGLPPARDWSMLRWADILREAASGWIAVLPLAATEQHGPHLPLGTDTMIAKAYLSRVRAALPERIPAVFLPVQEIGISSEHLDYPGTLTLPPEVAMQNWRALGESICRAGIRKLVMVSSHGGNSAAMSVVAQELRSHHKMLVVTTGWSRFGVPDGVFAPKDVTHDIHGGAIETSIMLAAWPDQVRREAIADFRIANDPANRHLSIHRPAPYAWQAQDLHPSGAIGDALLASADKGEKILDHGAKAFCELLDDVFRFDLDALDNQPAMPGR